MTNKISHASALSFSKTKIINTVFGLLVGFPLAFPAPPLYIFAFLAFGFSLPKTRKDAILFTKLAILIIIALISNLVALSLNQVTLLQAIYTSASFSLFLFGLGLSGFEQFFDGFVLMTNILAIAVVAIFVITQQYAYGLNLFISPTLRLWGDSWFPDWPNFFGALLGIGFLLKVLLKKPWYSVAVSGIAILLTTSRTPLLALIIGLLFYGQTIYKKKFFLGVFIFLAGSIFAIFVYLSWYGISDTLSISDQLQSRILKFNDRQIILEESIRLIKERPVLGHGSVRLFNITYQSFHNSYAEVLIRHGIIAFIAWILMLFPIKVLKFRSSGYLHMILYISLASMFQNLLKHPHFLMFLSVWVIHAPGIHAFLLTKSKTKKKIVRPQKLKTNTVLAQRSE